MSTVTRGSSTSSPEDAVYIEPTWKAALRTMVEEGLSFLVADIKKKLHDDLDREYVSNSKRDELSRKYLDFMDGIRLLSEEPYRVQSNHQEQRDTIDENSAAQFRAPSGVQPNGSSSVTPIGDSPITRSKTQAAIHRQAGNEVEQSRPGLTRSSSISSPREEELGESPENFASNQVITGDLHHTLPKHTKKRKTSLPTPPVTPRIEHEPDSIGFRVSSSIRTIHHYRRSVTTNLAYQRTPSQSNKRSPSPSTASGRLISESPSAPRERDSDEDTLRRTSPVSATRLGPSEHNIDGVLASLPSASTIEREPCEACRDEQVIHHTQQEAEEPEKSDGLERDDLSLYSLSPSQHQTRVSTSRIPRWTGNSNRPSSRFSTTSTMSASAFSVSESQSSPLRYGDKRRRSKGEQFRTKRSRSPKDQQRYENAGRRDQHSPPKVKTRKVKKDGEVGRSQEQPRKRTFKTRSPTALDLRVLSKLATVFKDVELYKELLSCPKEDAQAVLDVFQELLDTWDLPDDLRTQLIIAMQRLSERTQLYPLCFNLQSPVEILGDHPVNFGSYADIYKARSRGELLCLKVSRAHKTSTNKDIAKVHAREAILSGQLSHPNLLPFYGLYLFRETRVALVFPWADKGQISNYLERNHHANCILLWSDTAAGLHHLHERGIVHGDIKSSNVLVDGSGRARLSDFGLSSPTNSRILRWDSYSSIASKGGSIRWQAPELHEPEPDDAEPGTLVHNSKASDMYAWGCLGYEIFTGRVPFFQNTVATHVILKISGGELPTRPPQESPAWTERGLTLALWEMMEDCWKFQPQQRPNISEIISRLDLETPVDMRPPSVWHGRSPIQAQNLRGASLAHHHATMEDLDVILSRLPVN